MSIGDYLGIEVTNAHDARMVVGALREALRSLNTRIGSPSTDFPNLGGEVYGFTDLDRCGDSQKLGGVWKDFRFQMDLCNHSATTTNLKRLHIDGSALTPKVEFLNLAYPPSLELVHAINKRFTVDARALVKGTSRGQSAPSVDLTNLRIVVTDGLDRQHNILARRGEILNFTCH
jgi:hypothetical protein